MTPRVPAANALLLGAMLALAGACGDGGRSDGGLDASSHSPLVGTWSGSAHLANGEAITYTLQLHADHTVIVDDTITYPAGDPNQAGCTEADHGTGVTWSDASADGALLLTLDQSQGQVETHITGCADPSDNETLSGSDNELVPASSFLYTLDGTMLTLTPAEGTSGVLVLTRQ